MRRPSRTRKAQGGAEDVVGQVGNMPPQGIVRSLRLLPDWMHKRRCYAAQRFIVVAHGLPSLQGTNGVNGVSPLVCPSRLHSGLPRALLSANHRAVTVWDT